MKATKALDGRPAVRTNKASVFDDLRSDILAGRLEPGSKLPFAGLVTRFECSVGAIREALQRLANRVW